MKTIVACILLAFTSLLQAAPASAAFSSASFPFSQIGAKATEDYKGDAISIRIIPEGAELRTGFQKLAGTVTQEGLHLQSTDAGAGSLRLTAAALGRTGSLAVELPRVGQVTAADQTIRFTRQGLVEEFSVRVDGLRQDFIMPRAPGGSGPLSLELALSGATAESAADGVKLTLDGSRRELAYSRLKVTDAQNQDLTARLVVLSPTRLAVQVEDAGAVYPVRIDPTFSDADWVNTMNSSIPGANGDIQATVADGSGNIYIGGAFSMAGAVRARNIAKWDGSAWSALGQGISGRVTCLAVSGTTLYAGGDFLSAGGAPAENIAKWNGSAWSSLGTGVGGAWNQTLPIVSAMAVNGTDLYVGGTFGSAGGVPGSNNIAKWNGSAWAAVGSGIQGRVLALTLSGTNLYAGGEFTTAGGVAGTSNIAKWNGSAWSALGSGMNGGVWALAASGTDLYAGGDFTATGGVAGAGYIAKWNGSAWSSAGTGLVGIVRALAVSGTDLYAGGDFFISGGGVEANSIAKWNGSAWSSVGTGVVGSVNALAVSGTELYVGGLSLIRAGGTGVLGVAKWNGIAWTALGTGLNRSVEALAVIGTDIYAGGLLTTAGTGAAGISYIAKWNGSAWSALGSGIMGSVSALAVSGTDLYAGGAFATAGGVAASRVAKWNGTTWSALGQGMNNTVFALRVKGTDLYAGGRFTTAGGTAANYIAKWNGSSWSALGSGMDGNVNALVVSGTDLYAGGVFVTAGGVAASRIAKWNGSSWSALGSGLNGEAYALAVSGTDLYAGGRFTTAGGASGTGYIARWNGSAWSALGSGNSGIGTVYSLLMSGGDLYTGGAFATMGGLAASNIAKWNGSAWSALGTGLNGSVKSLALDARGQLVLGGNFTLAGSTAIAPYIVQAKLPAEIALSGGGHNIASGDQIPDLADGTAYGSVTMMGGALVRTFTITNSGSAALNLTGIAPAYVTLSGSSAFSVATQPTAGSIPAAGGMRTFSVSFDPATSGLHTATVSIVSDDDDENPFTFALRGTGVTAVQLFTETMTTAGLSGSAGAHDAAPRGDGVVNLLKYAFNMNLHATDRRVLTPTTGTGGLPSITAGSGSVLRVEYLRRLGSGLLYTPQRSPDLITGSWTPLSDVPTVTPIDAQWERIIYEEPVPHAPRGFVRVLVAFEP